MHVMHIEMVKDCTYLGLSLSSDACDIDFIQIAKASKVFGSLQMSIYFWIIIFLSAHTIREPFIMN